MIRVAINGYGRIGRLAHRVILEKFLHEIEIVGINVGSSDDMQGWMYLLKYDTVYGKLKNVNLSFISGEKVLPDFETKAKFIGFLVIDNKKIPFFADRDPKNLPWKELNVDTVIESTGKFRTEEELKGHLEAGAKSVVLSAPCKGDSIKTYILGVNLQYKNQKNLEKIISNASCTTNAIAPIAQIIEKKFGIEKAMMTTIHAYTSDQRLQDGSHKDPRRARAAAQNIIPTSTGATEAAAKAEPALSGKFSGLAIRVPVATGSLADFTFLIKKDTTVEEVNEVLEKEALSENYKNILFTTRDPLVSSDIIGEIYSSVIDLSLTQVVGGNMIKIIAWYDNEYGYSNRLVEEALILGKIYTS